MEILDARKTAPEFVPICPHCEHELKHVYRLHDTSRGMKLETSRGYGYACPHCRKLLGFADWSIH